MISVDDSISSIGQAHNFDKYNDSYVDTLGTSYDYGSLMHYAKNEFNSNGAPTIVPTKNSSAIIGQRVGLSPIDILEIQRYYGCVATDELWENTADSANECQRGSKGTSVIFGRLSLMSCIMRTIVCFIGMISLQREFV